MFAGFSVFISYLRLLCTNMSLAATLLLLIQVEVEIEIGKDASPPVETREI